MQYMEKSYILNSFKYFLLVRSFARSEFFWTKRFSALILFNAMKIIKPSGLFIYRKKNETPYKKLGLNLEQKKVTLLPNANIELRSSWLAKMFKPNFKNQEKRNYTKRLVAGFYYSFSVTIAKILNLDFRLRARE